MNQLNQYPEKAGILECHGNPPKEVAEAIHLYNELLDESMLPLKEVPTKAKRPIFNLLQLEGLQAAILTNNTLNRRTWLIKNDNQWTEYTLHTDFAEMFRSLISNSFLPEEQQHMPVSQIMKRRLKLSLSYIFRFKHLAICNKETLLEELNMLRLQNPQLEIN